MKETNKNKEIRIISKIVNSSSLGLIYSTPYIWKAWEKENRCAFPSPFRP
jgi:hypothetical protein